MQTLPSPSGIQFRSRVNLQTDDSAKIGKIPCSLYLRPWLTSFIFHFYDKFIVRLITSANATCVVAAKLKEINQGTHQYESESRRYQN